MHNSKRGDLLALGLARLANAGARASPRRTVRDGGRSRAVAALSGAAAGEGRSASSELVLRRAAPSRKSRISASDAYVPWAGHLARHAMTDVMAAIKSSQDRAHLRQHAQPGRAHLPGTVAHQRRQSRHRAASRLARAGAAPQGRSGDDARQSARRGLHLDARSRHRLGRGRQGDLHRRAQGRRASGAAHRPRQSPARRAVAARCSCRPTASRCWNATPRAMRCWPASSMASG